MSTGRVISLDTLVERVDREGAQLLRWCWLDIGGERNPIQALRGRDLAVAGRVWGVRDLNAWRASIVIAEPSRPIPTHFNSVIQVGDSVYAQLSDKPGRQLWGEAGIGAHAHDGEAMQRLADQHGWRELVPAPQPAEDQTNTNERTS